MDTSSLPVFQALRFLRAKVIVVALCCLVGVASPLPVWAGHYALFSQTGGVCNYGPEPEGPTYYGPVEGGYGAGGGGGDYSNCSGSITTTYVWIADDTSDLPPNQVVVRESCRVAATGFGYYAPTTLEADNGIGSPSVFQSGEAYPGVYSWSKTSEGVRTQIKSGGHTVEVTCSPSTSVAGFGLQVGSSVVYGIAVGPIKIELGGSTPFGNQKAVLTGQEIVAQLSSGGLTASNFSWDTSGAVFKSFDVSQGQTQGEENINVIKNQGEFSFFTKKNQILSVSCSATLHTPEGQSFSVSASASLNSIKPTADWNITGSATRLNGVGQTGQDSPNGPANATMYGPFDPNRSDPDRPEVTIYPGQRWKMGFTFDPPFLPSGSGAIVQLYAMTFSAKTDQDGEVVVTTVNRLLGLDKVFPYSDWSITTASSFEDDSPSSPLSAPGLGTVFYSQTSRQYDTWLMFRPSGVPKPGGGQYSTSYIPIRKYHWEWGGVAELRATKGTEDYFWYLLSKNGAPLTASSSETMDFPRWTQRNP